MRSSDPFVVLSEHTPAREDAAQQKLRVCMRFCSRRLEVLQPTVDPPSVLMFAAQVTTVLALFLTCSVHGYCTNGGTGPQR